MTLAFFLVIFSSYTLDQIEKRILQSVFVPKCLSYQLFTQRICIYYNLYFFYFGLFQYSSLVHEYLPSLPNCNPAFVPDTILSPQGCGAGYGHRSHFLLTIINICQVGTQIIYPSMKRNQQYRYLHKIKCKYKM